MLYHIFQDQVLQEVEGQVSCDSLAVCVEGHQVRLHQVLSHVYEFFETGDGLGGDHLLYKLFEDYLDLLSFKSAQELTLITEFTPLAQCVRHLKFIYQAYRKLLIILSIDGLEQILIIREYDQLDIWLEVLKVLSLADCHVEGWLCGERLDVLAVQVEFMDHLLQLLILRQKDILPLTIQR